MNHNRWIGMALASSCFLVMMFGAQVSAGAPRVGRAIVTHVSGTAEYRSDQGKTWKPIAVGVALSEGHIVRTDEGSSLDLVLTTHAIIRLLANSRLQIEKLSQDTQGLPAPGKKPTCHTQLTLQEGVVLVRTGKPAPDSSFFVRARTGVARILGSSMMMWVAGDRVCLRVTQHSVTFQLGENVHTLKQDEQMCVPYDPKTGKINDQEAAVVLVSSGDDSWAEVLREFEEDVLLLEDAVLGDDPVDVERVLQLVGTRFPQPSTPKVILIGNPAALTEVSPSSP